MPARNSSMEISSPSVEPATSAAASSRRKSGRVTHKPSTYRSSPAGSVKRKRTGEDNASDEEEGENDVDMEDASDESEAEPDEEEVKEKKKRAARKRKDGAAKKPAAKKSKVNGEVSLAIRPAKEPGAAPKRKKTTRPTKRSAEAAEGEEGLYTDVFAQGLDPDEVAAAWVNHFKEHESEAVMNLFNFVLKCAGCDETVDVHVVEDPDHFTDKLSDIQDAYQAQNPTDYPLIMKGRAHTNFRHSLTGFFHSLIKTFAVSSILDDPTLMENIIAWIGTMSSAGNRPFRHTATVASLSITSALCEVARETVDSTAKTRRQMESEGKKTRVNKGRLADLEKKVQHGTEAQEALESYINNWFDTVFVHRYRDIDPRIRVDCVQALGDWIMTYPDLFFEGTFLRYLGWVLSDSVAHTRLEVVKQLQRLFKDNDKLGGLKTFTERFRSRMVEMATRDAEASVRAAAVELLDTLREAGLLEADDIDSVGRLIFDSEPRVRKSVVGFFAENINDLFESKVDDLGGQEALDEALVTVEGDDDFDNPRIEWLKYKCLVEVLQSYDADEETLPTQIERGPDGTSYGLVASGLESRFSLASQVLYDQIPEVRTWETLAGYLLFDHSQTTQNGTSSDDVEVSFKKECRLADRDEIILLEVLNAAVKLALSQHLEDTHKKTKKPLTKAQKTEILEEQETAARHLAILIPRLLKKFGALPEAASSVLRLENVLNLDVFEELRQDSTRYSELLDDINKQFLTHGSARVLAEASAALLHAQSYEELGEVTEGKVQALWEDTVNSLHALRRNRDLKTRGTLSTNVFTTLSNTVLRIHNLASISDCIEALEAPPVITASQKGKGKATAAAADAIDVLLDLLSRGLPSPNTDKKMDMEVLALEDALVIHAAKTLLFYFMWKINSWKRLIATSHTTQPIPDPDLDIFADRRDRFADALKAILKTRRGADDVRRESAGVFLDLYTLLMTLRQGKPKMVKEDDAIYLAFALEIEGRSVKLLLSVLGATEKAYAKKAGKNLVEEEEEEMDPTQDPEDDEEEVEDEDEDDEARKEEKAAGVLVAEQRVCEFASKLVLGLLAGVFEDESVEVVKERLEKNKTRLGSNFKEVVAYLDKTIKENEKKNKRPKKKAEGKKDPKAKSKEIVVESDTEEVEDIEDDDDEETLRRKGLLVEEDKDVEEPDGASTTGAQEEAESVLGD